MPLRVTMDFNNTTRSVRANNYPDLYELCCLAFDRISKYQFDQMKAGHTIRVVALGTWHMEEVPSTEAPCKECWGCKFGNGECIEEDKDNATE